MPVVPNLLERLLFLTLNQAPGPVLDIFGAVAFRIVHTAVRLRVFDTLHQHPLEPAELARQLDTDERGITVLLEALTSLGYVTVQDGRYTNTAMTVKWLVRSSPSNISAGFDYWGAILSQLLINPRRTKLLKAPGTSLIVATKATNGRHEASVRGTRRA